MAAPAAYQALEEAFSSYIGVDYVITTNSGTSALHLAIAGMHYPSGAEIIVPEFSMIATALAPYYARCTPVFVDCLDDMNMDPEKVREKITEKTTAIMITHVYGRICSVQPFLDICEEFNLDLIEDCAEVHGAIYHDGPRSGERVGSLGLGCFSFYRNKIVAAEEGGAVCIAQDSGFASHLRDLKNMSFGDVHNYVHEHIGFNYRMPDAEAALALNSLSQIESSLAKRKEIESWYDAFLDEHFVRPQRDVVWIYDINCKEPEAVVKILNDKGIAARRTFAPMSMQPCLGVKPDVDTLNAYALYLSTCYLPVSTSMDKADVETIAAVVNEVANDSVSTEG